MNERVLTNGAKLLTRLTDKEINHLNTVSEHHRVKQRPKSKLSVEQDKKNGIFYNSSLKLVNIRLGIDLVKQIKIIDALRKNSNEPDREIVVLDWGAGNGRALLEISNQLKLSKISNVRLVGFGDSLFKEWDHLSKGIEMILDVEWKLPLYFKKNAIDLIYSHCGLRSVGDWYSGYYKMVYSLLRDGGMLFMDGSQVFNRHPVYSLKKVSRKCVLVRKYVYEAVT